MTTYKMALPNGGRLEVYTKVYSDVLVEAGTGPLNALARRGAAVAKRQVKSSGKKFIGMKPVKRFKLESRDIGQPRSELASMLEVPVALIFNNSHFAVKQEVGSLSKDKRVERPMRTALLELRSERGVRGIQAKELKAEVDKGTRSRASRRKKKRGRS